MEDLKPDQSGHKQEYPLAYRDKDGTIKNYEEGKEPFVWVKDGSEKTKITEDRGSNSPTSSMSSQISGTGESYTEYKKSSGSRVMYRILIFK
jgi:hypothetical protein